MVFVISRRRRNAILLCTAVAAGGYASYRFYRSPAVARRRLRVYMLLKSLSSLLEAFAEGSNSAGAVFKDLHGFLLSDRDEVPQSLRQLFKVAGCHEVQKTVSALSASVTEGVFSSITAGRPQAGVLRHKYESRCGETDGWGGKGNGGYVGPPEEKVLSWKDKEVSSPREDGSAEEILYSPDTDDTDPWMQLDERWKDCDNGAWEQSSWKSAGSVLDGVQMQVGASIAKCMQEELVGKAKNRGGMKGREKENLADRLVEKLFSDAGKGFASAVVASASRSLVVSVLEHMGTLKQPKKQSSPSNGEDITDVLGGIVEFACSSKGKTLITECIQTFVGTAVSVYLDGTKDVNIYDDLIEGFVKPDHRGPVTDLLTTVCSGTVQALVRTSHEVLTADTNGATVSTHPGVFSRAATLGLWPHRYGELVPLGDPLLAASYISPQDEGSASSSKPVSEPSSKFDVPEVSHRGSKLLTRASASISLNGGATMGARGVRQGEDAASRKLIDGLSSALAVPSNRKLIMEVAGTMTSEGVRSLIEVSLGRLSTAFSGRTKEQHVKEHGRETAKRSAIGDTLQQVGDLTKTAVDKSMVLMTMCFALCLHSVAGGVRMLQPF